jgi:hypothetical protein
MVAVSAMRATVRDVGFLSRLFIPRGVRRAAHPGRAVKRAVTPKSVKRARRAMHPLSNAVYSFERSLNTKPRRRGPKAPVYRHGACTVNHRSPEAASRCRRTY